VGAFEYTVCDVFTDRPLAGNQLGVFPDATPIPEALLQPLARELNYSETVFCYPAEHATARLRIFTPAREIAFAGHPVLGAAAVLGGGEVRLETGAGAVTVTVASRGPRAAFGRMRQPIPSVDNFPAAETVCAALGVPDPMVPVEAYDNGIRHAYVILDDEGAVAAVTPDMAALERAAPDAGVSCAAGADGAWTTRMFAPGLGVAEDPATGSAAGPLAVHLARHGLIAFGDEITIAQGAAVGRPSTLYAQARGDRDRLDAVEVAGGTVIVAHGAFELS
jgi:trans-2,3-dihydro-3-hydroxyanthranilate isomerase